MSDFVIWDSTHSSLNFTPNLHDFQKLTPDMWIVSVWVISSLFLSFHPFPFCFPFLAMRSFPPCSFYLSCIRSLEQKCRCSHQHSWPGGPLADVGSRNVMYRWHGPILSASCVRTCLTLAAPGHRDVSRVKLEAAAEGSFGGGLLWWLWKSLWA